MCVNRKQTLNFIAAFGAVLLALSSAHAASGSVSLQENKNPSASMGQLSIGEGAGGITDRAYIVAPPNSLFVVEITPGSFLNCGEQMEMQVADADGRHLASLTCGVTLTETVVIPAASESATITVHY